MADPKTPVRSEAVTSWEFAKAQGSWALAEAAYEALLEVLREAGSELEAGDDRKAKHIIQAALPATEPAQPEEERPEGWPEKCGNCGADWTCINFEIVDGFNCSKCGASDSDE